MSEQLVQNLQSTVRSQAALINQLERHLEEMRLYLDRSGPNVEASLRKLALAQKALADYRS